MRHRCLYPALAAILALASPQIVLGQISQRAVFNPVPAPAPLVYPFSPNNRPPAISPYLNLLRGGDPSVNYFLDVVPALQKRQQQLEAPVAVPTVDPKLNEQYQEILGRRPLNQTGSYTGFGVYNGAYFLPGRGYVPYTPPGFGRIPVP